VTRFSRLSGVITPVVDRDIHALRDVDDDAFDEMLDHVVGAIDSPEQRLTLADAVL
jgi:hypothetical protein